MDNILTFKFNNIHYYYFKNTIHSYTRNKSVKSILLIKILF